MTLTAAAIDKDSGNRSYLIWRRSEPQFRLAIDLLPSLRDPSDAGAFDLYVAATEIAVFEGEVRDDLPRTLDAARALKGSVDDRFTGSYAGDPASVGYWAGELADTNDDWGVDFDTASMVRRRALTQRWAEQPWFSSEVCRRRAVAMALEPCLIRGLSPEYYLEGADLPMRHDHQVVRQVLWLLSPANGVTLLLRDLMQGHSVRALAASCGVRQSTITLWKRGAAIPQPRRYGQLAAALDTGVTTLAAAAADRVPTWWSLDPGERPPA